MWPLGRWHCQLVAIETVVHDTLATVSAGMSQQNMVLQRERERGESMKGCWRRTRGLTQRWWTGRGLKQAARVLEERNEGGMKKNWPTQQQIVSEFPKFTGFRRWRQFYIRAAVRNSSHTELCVPAVVVRWLLLYVHGRSTTTFVFMFNVIPSTSQCPHVYCIIILKKYNQWDNPILEL